ncbi:MAG: SDR family oxidoreductase [Clostridiales bacterium]|nr:SDR family oxidoreductase [Clostridiales bacterium]
MISAKGKWALITGASRGIGKELSLFMAKQGCNLILHSRKLEHTAEVLRAVKGIGVEAFAVEAELSDNNSVKSMLKDIDELELEIDFIFNNAGVQIAYRNDYYTTPISDFSISFQINFIAITTICYHFLPKMIERGFGRIINTTSGIENEPEQAGYSASKAALDKYTIDLGSKLNGTNVMINLVDPGWCRTDLGGPQAPNDVKSTLPGVAIPAFLDDQISGRIFRVQEFNTMTLEEAVSLIENT